MNLRNIILHCLVIQTGILMMIGTGASSASAAETKPDAHWSLQPLQPPPIPKRFKASNPIDSFIKARLAEKGLAMSPQAHRATLIRRVTFDLLGLPATPQEVDQFVSDSSPHAFEQLVERLLASPQYGEKWGRHWLDVARYTESQGFEYDRLRPNAWHYRDYVIASFNSDKPYDQFMKEQIAGDVLEPISKEGMIATSLLVCGPWDQAGSSQANAIQRATTREEELEDLIAVVGQGFLGLTINCARCHAHKFDPIPHAEYYRIKSVFEGVKHGEREISPADKNKSGSKPVVSYIGTRSQPESTKRLKRGEVKSPQETVSPAGLSAIAELNPEFGLAPDSPESQRRIKFAEWLSNDRNPLPSRVMANRVWQYHFGQGLVATPSDFGLNGARPTHPELLDWLATQFIHSGWSVKTLHRLILNSETYQQQSRFDAKAYALDADGQFLWRFPPRRLTAEELRDAMLTVSGEINPRMQGPSFRPFTVANFNSDFYQPTDPLGPEFNRRTVYRMNVNSGKEPLLDAFDCPDPSVKTPRRNVTTTPLQALALMNNSFVQRQAAKLAARARLDSKNDNDAIRAAYRLALGRAPTNHEMNQALEAIRERDLSTVCWALLNCTEFVYVQ